ncbi:MAG: TIGR04190 family B12-binding domain/radical SAM domain protein, partial [Dehalococcoidia bacterium]
VVTCRGCTHGCTTCGGSRYAYENSFGRKQTAYRSPRLLVKDITSIQRFLNGPVFLVGDIRQSGDDYADELLWHMKSAKVRGPLVLELFAPAGGDFFKKVSDAVPNYFIQWSPDSTDEVVRQAFGRGYSNRELENTIQSALENRCKRFDLFFMTGLPRQTYGSVMANADYLNALLGDVGQLAKGRLLPFISPLAPFLDPGSKAFENPQKYGYHLFHHTLEEHRQALKSPSWKYMLNYETEWMTKDEIVMSTYEAGLAFNQLKAEHGLIAREVASEVEARAKGAIQLMRKIDRIVSEHGFDCAEIQSLKQDADKFSSSSICQKKELHWPAVSFVRNAPRILWAFATGGD